MTCSIIDFSGDVACTVGNIGTIVGCGLMVVMAVFQAFMCRHLFNPCNVTNFAIVKDITPTEAEQMFKKVADDGPNAANALFIMSLTSRLESACFVGMGFAAIFTLAIPLEDRYAALFVFGMVGLVCLSVSMNHVGCLPFFGTNPFLTEDGKGEAKSICILWAMTHTGLWIAFVSSLALKAKANSSVAQGLMTF